MKVRAIQEMQPPQNLRELRGLKGGLAFLWRSICIFSGRCHPFSKVMKKRVSFIRDQSCQDAFGEIKHYLMNIPIFAALIAGKPLMLYVRTMHHSLGALLAQYNDQGHEQTIYYLKRTMVGVSPSTIQLKRSALPWCLPSRRCDITWWVKQSNSYQKSTLYPCL